MRAVPGINIRLLLPRYHSSEGTGASYYAPGPAIGPANYPGGVTVLLLYSRKIMLDERLGFIYLLVGLDFIKAVLHHYPLGTLLHNIHYYRYPKTFDMLDLLEVIFYPYGYICVLVCMCPVTAKNSNIH